MIEVSDVKVVMKIAKAGSIHLAAMEVGLTQPALTKRLKAIEERTGFEIFHRMPRGVKLTRLGELLLEKGEELIIHSQDIKEEINRHKIGEQGELRIGVRPCIQSVFFRKSLISFASTYPGINLKIDTRDAPLICDAIREGLLDFAVIGLGYEDEFGADPTLHSSLKFQPLFRLPVSIVVRHDHPVLLTETRPEDFLRYPVACEPPPSIVQRKMTRIAQKAGIPFDGPRILVNDYDFILRLVTRSDFWTAVFSENAKELSYSNEFAFIENEELVSPVVVGICSRKNWTMPQVAMTLVNLLKKNAEPYLIEETG